MIVPFNGVSPRIDASAFVHSSAHVVGDVEVGAESSLWFNVVARGDVHRIHIGSRTNVQDRATLHVTKDTWPTIIGNEVTVAHGVILHGCNVGDRCLIGIGAIVLDGAEIEADCMIGAGSLVAPRTRVPAGHLALGSPAKIRRPLRREELQHLRQSAANYVEYATAYRAQRIL
jgi:carbonic anhydrase/acetyltransferase-like protein (isoleucine patch superfamily)